MNIVRHLIGWRRQAHTTETTEEKKEKTDEGTEEKREKSDGVLFNHIPWNNVDIQQHFDAVTMNKEESENLLSDQNFSDDGTFLIRVEVTHEEYEKNIFQDGSQKNMVLSLVFDRKIHHHKIILMDYFKRYSYCLERGGINFASISMLIKYHMSKMTLPLPCVLKRNKEQCGVKELALKSSTVAILPSGMFSASPRLVRSSAQRVRNRDLEEKSKKSLTKEKERDIDMQQKDQNFSHYGLEVKNTK